MLSTMSIPGWAGVGKEGQRHGSIQWKEAPTEGQPACSQGWEPPPHPHFRLHPHPTAARRGQGRAWPEETKLKSVLLRHRSRQGVAIASLDSAVQKRWSLGASAQDGVHPRESNPARPLSKAFCSHRQRAALQHAAPTEGCIKHIVKNQSLPFTGSAQLA